METDREREMKKEIGVESMKWNGQKAEQKREFLIIATYSETSTFNVFD